MNPVHSLHPTSNASTPLFGSTINVNLNKLMIQISLLMVVLLFLMMVLWMLLVVRLVSPCLFYCWMFVLLIYSIPLTSSPVPSLLLTLTPTPLGKHYNERLLMTSHQFTADIITYRNNPDKFIVIYDQDESIASRVAQAFAERDITNVWMLSGGKFPLSLIN